MKLKLPIDPWRTVILLCILYVSGCPGAARAQDKSIADTIAYILRQHKDPAGRCDALYALGTYYFNIGDAASALLTMNQCKTEAEKHAYDRGMYDAYAIIGAVYLKQNDIEKIRSIVHECLQLAKQNNNEYGANRANYLLALMYSQQGELDSMILICRRTVEATHTIYDSVNLPKFNSLLGNAYLDNGDFVQASKYYLDALMIAEKTHNEPLQMVCIGNLALISDELKNYQEALAYQRRAQILAQKHSQVQALAGSYHSMGSIYRSLHKPDSALLCFKQALQLYTQFGLAQDLSVTYTNIGATLVELNQPDSGVYYLQLAKEQFIQSKDTLHIANNALMLGSVWRQLGQSKNDRSYFQQAQKELDVCQAIAEQKSVEDLKMNCYYQQAVLYEAMGDDSKAFLYLKLYSLISDSIRSEQYTRQIAEMQTKYETEKKETEIGKLNAEKQLATEKIARQKVVNYSLMSMAALILLSGSLIFRNFQKKRTAEKQVAILEKQNAIESMRSKIASDVHDEMGANLTRLGLNAQQLLQSPAVPDKEKQLAEKMSLQSKEILTGMREIIWASNPANDNLKSMLGFMRQYIDRFFDGTNLRPIVNFPHDIGEVTLHPEVRRNLFLILKESLNNALKYSDSDRIDIDFQTENEKYQFKVTDYGKGLDEENKNDFSNGLRNMQMRAEQIQSLFKLIAAPGQGVQIIVEGKLY